MFELPDDPTGAGLKIRAAGHRRNFQDQEAERYKVLQQAFPGIGMYGPMRSSLGKMSSGPLPDPAWEGLFQAMSERGVSKVKGAAEPFGALPSTYDPEPQASALHTRQIARPLVARR